MSKIMMVPDVEGDSRERLHDYYQNSITNVQNSIDAQDEDFVLNRDTDELVEYFIQDYLLPTLQEDTSKQPIIEKLKSGGGASSSRVSFKVGIPLVLEEGIEQTVSRRASTYVMGFGFSLDNGALTITMNLPAPAANPEQSVENELGQLRKTIGYKNDNVKHGNETLRQTIKQYIQSRKNKLENENNVIKTIAQKLPINLKQKPDTPVTDLKVKKKIKILLPEKKESKEPYLPSEALDAVISLIREQGRSFELTPKVFSTLEEERLRDIILSTLNAVLEGDATAETFVKLGKTDICLKLKIKGGILSAECKFWAGEKLYIETIDQHFRYLTWQQSKAIQITFSKNQGFTDVIEKAKKATMEHPTFVTGSLKEIDEQYFVSEHTFPDDPKKKVEFHHLLFNLYSNDG